jgi:hypothetical protein
LAGQKGHEPSPATRSSSDIRGDSVSGADEPLAVLVVVDVVVTVVPSSSHHAAEVQHTKAHSKSARPITTRIFRRQEVLSATSEGALLDALALAPALVQSVSKPFFPFRVFVSVSRAELQ